jgi:predicted Zn-dependent peptidase
MNTDVAELEKSMDDIIKDVQTNLISDKEFQRVQNQVENDFISANNRVVGVAQSLATYEMFYGDANLINTELERYRKVTKEDLRNAAKTYLSKNKSAVLYYLPVKTP